MYGAARQAQAATTDAYRRRSAAEHRVWLVAAAYRHPEGWPSRQRLWRASAPRPPASRTGATRLTTWAACGGFRTEPRRAEPRSASAGTGRRRDTGPGPADRVAERVGRRLAPHGAGRPRPAGAGRAAGSPHADGRTAEPRRPARRVQQPRQAPERGPIPGRPTTRTTPRRSRRSPPLPHAWTSRQRSAPIRRRHGRLHRSNFRGRKIVLGWIFPSSAFHPAGHTSWMIEDGPVVPLQSDYRRGSVTDHSLCQALPSRSKSWQVLAVSQWQLVQITRAEGRQWYEPRRDSPRSCLLGQPSRRRRQAGRSAGPTTSGSQPSALQRTCGRTVPVAGLGACTLIGTSGCPPQSRLATQRDDRSAAVECINADDEGAALCGALRLSVPVVVVAVGAVVAAACTATAPETAVQSHTGRGPCRLASRLVRYRRRQRGAPV